MTRLVSGLEARVEREIERLVAVGAFSDLRRQVRHEMYAAPGWSGCSCQFTDPPPGAVLVRCVVVDFEVTGPDGDTLTLDAKGYLAPNGAQAVAYKFFTATHGRRIIPIPSETRLVDFAPVVTATRPGGISLVTSAPPRRNRRK